MKSHIWFISLVIFLGGCQTSELLPSDKQALLFPHGTYHQSVLVEILKGRKSTVEFEMVVRKTPDGLAATAFNSMGITLMTMKSEPDKDLEISSSFDQINRHKKTIGRFFPVVQKLLRFSARDPQGQLRQLQREIPAHVEFAFDSGSTIPRSVLIRGQSLYSVKVTNRKFVALDAERPEPGD